MAVSFCGKRLLLKRNNFLLTRRHYGYIVLVPEIGEDLPDKNPLLGADDLPVFNNQTIETCVGAITNQSIQYEATVKNLEDTIDKSQNVISDLFTPLEHLDSSLELTWGVAKTLYLGNNSLMPTKSYMSIHERAHRARTSKYRSIPIYQAVVKAKLDEKSLTEEESRLLSKYSLESHLNGLNVTDDHKKTRLSGILQELQTERKVFREKNELSIKQFSHIINDPNLVRDFPDPLLKAMSSDPNEPNKGPWKVTLQSPLYESFMEHCPDKVLRWNAWQANIRRSSGYGDKSLQTSINLENIRGLRQQQAQILGYETYAHMSMETKMAGSVDNVKNMITNLVQRARPIQDVELEQLGNFARDRGFSGNIEQADLAYWKRKQMKSLYDFDEEKIRDYFPLPVVLDGLFDLCCKLFDIKIVERPKASTWHEDVKYYDIFDSDSRSPIAGFYFDPYARENEKIQLQDDRGWMVAIRNRSTIAETQPLAALIFNFQVPIYGKPSLLTFNDVQILFHKFGHSLRHLLTEANYSDVAGLSNIEWDSAEVCGHVMTHWLYESSTLKSISKHYATQEILPDNVIRNMQCVRQHMSATSLCNELYLSSLDIQLYTTKVFWRDIIKELWPKYHSLPFDKYDSLPCYFMKIVSGDWAAAYYSDVWSRIIAADVFSAFYEARHEEKDILDIGQRYRDTFLASGGSCHPSETFRRFRGRDPSHKALLYTLGLKKSTNTETPTENQ